MLCFMAALFSYASLFVLFATPNLNTLLGSKYDSFDYPRIPSYGTPVKLREVGHRYFDFDFEDVADKFFRPAFELDRKFARKTLWGGFDFRDVGPKNHSPNKGRQATASPSPAT